jgi:hypothetical protein
LLVAVCADGAGSARQSQVGARLACTAFLGLATTALEDGLGIGDVSEPLVLRWHELVRQRLSLEACLANLDLREYACTLLAAVVGEDRAVVSQVGDGVVVIGTEGGYEPVFWPRSGEYVNTTYFLTGGDFAAQLVCRVINARIDEIALLTDGLQPLALHYATRTAHRPFFEPMFMALREAPSPEHLQLPLMDFLASKAVNDRTDDDKTLVLATRHSPSHDCP